MQLVLIVCRFGGNFRGYDSFSFFSRLLKRRDDPIVTVATFFSPFMLTLLSILYSKSFLIRK